MMNVCDSFDMPKGGNLLVTAGVITFGTVRPGTTGGQ
jgi:hypothetical protein